MRRILRQSAFLAGLSLLLSCVSTRAHYEIKLPDLHTTLPNGLRVIVLPDDTTQLVAVAMRYEVGSNEDPVGKEGLAHLVEHIMFQWRPKDDAKGAPVMSLLRQLTVYVNAQTHYEWTHYDELAARENLEALIALEAARMVNAGQVVDPNSCLGLDEDTFLREREVVRNEIRTRLGAPEAQVFYLLSKDVYPAGHPYAHFVGGNDETVANITLQDVCQFMKDYYVPSRAVLLVAGNTTPDEMKGLVAGWFGGIENTPAKPRTVVPPLVLEKRTFTHELDVETTTVSVAWKLPAAFSADEVAGQFMMGRVQGGAGAEGDEWEFALGTGVIPLGGELAPAFVVQVELKSASDVDKALDAIWRAARNANRGLEADSEGLEDLRAQMIARKVYSFEDLNARTSEFANYAQFDKSGEYFGGELGRIKRISLGKIKSYIGGALDKDDAVVVIVKPKQGAQRGDKRAGKAYTGNAQEVQDEVGVDPAEARQRLAVPKGSVLSGAQRLTLGNGMRVVLLPSGGVLPVMTVELVFDAGSAQEPPDKAGLADVAAGYLRLVAGTGLGGEIVVGDALSKVGAQEWTEVTADHTIFGVRGLNIYQGVLIKGLERLIKVGEYQQESIESYQKYYSFGLKRAEGRQQLALRKAITEALYGEGHPYTVTGQPTEKTIGRLGRDAAMSFRGKHYTAKNATLIVAGNFDVKAVESSIRSNFGDWSGGHQDQPVAVTVPQGAQVIGVQGEERPQIQAFIAYGAPAGVDGQYPARLVLAEMISLRVSAVREELGTSYGLYAQLRTQLGGGAYVIGGSGIDTARAGESIDAMRKRLDALRAGEGFEADFVRARRTVLKGLLQNSTASTDLAGRLEFLAKYHLDEKFQEKLVKQVAALSPEQVKQLVADELRPDREIVVCLGSKAALDKAFADAQLKVTRWVDATGEKK